MSINQNGQRVLSTSTKWTTRNGVIETTVTEVVDLGNGATKTITRTTRSDQTPHSAPTIGNVNHPQPNLNSGGSFADTCLQWHNYYRSQHGVPALELSQSLSNYAQEWANRLASEDSFRHREQSTYGENIYTQWSSNANFDISGKDPVDSWYSEIKDYVFGVNSPSSLVAGHFTQVVWKDSKSLGVGKAKSRSGKIIVVCNYDPPGNMAGKYAAMVPRER